MRLLILFALLTGLMLAATSRADACKRITAAVNLQGLRILFFGEKMIYLDTDGNQVAEYLVRVHGWRPADAAMVLPNVNGTGAKFTIFSGDYLYNMDTAFSNRLEPSDIGYGEQSDFFKGGIDAAGVLHGTGLLFKGCKFLIGANTPLDLPEGFPCNMDAAMEVGESELWLFRDDKLWKVSLRGVAPNMPVETSSEIHLTDIRLCREGEGEEGTPEPGSVPFPRGDFRPRPGVPNSRRG